MKTWKDRVKSDYSDIRGVHHGPSPGKTMEQLDRELSYADRLNVNSVRMGGMMEGQWHEDPEGTEKRILDYTRLCAKHGITVMPVLSSGNSIKNYEMLTEAQWEKKRRYLTAMVKLLKPEPNMLMWDVYNEPFCNDYLRGAPKDEYETRFKKIEHDLRKQFEIMRELDDDTPMTVGHELAEHLESTLDLVDVIAFHDYLRTRKAVGEMYEYAKQCSIRTGGKPVINNEMGCIGRSNPYDVELQFCEQYNYGYYIFCLMIEGFWGPLHGIVYPDGTVRDPSIVAAMFGFYRNRSKTRILPQGNREEYATDAVERVKKALAVDKKSLFTKFEAPTEEILEAAENCVNILECCEIVPMDNPLSAQLQELRDDPDVESRRDDIKRFAYDAAKKLQEYYCLF
jgi:hypothetical protein